MVLGKREEKENTHTKHDQNKRTNYSNTNQTKTLKKKKDDKNTSFIRTRRKQDVVHKEKKL